jgi:molybdopterin-guanine dinucleotide biosynthesis protein B
MRFQMKETCFIGVVGHKKSGKTTLIENLAVEMNARGLAIGTIKMTIHDLEFDSPGKDTHRHRAAGARLTLIKSKSQMALFTQSDFFDDQSIRAAFQKCAFVFIEGDSDPRNPKIYVADQREMRPDVTGEIIAFWGEKKEMAGAAYFGKKQVAELCEFLINRYQQ